MPKYCRNCKTYRESRYEITPFGSDSQCSYCSEYTLIEGEVQTYTVTRTITEGTSCGQNPRNYSTESRYCQFPGCFTRFFGDITDGYCSEHSQQKSGLDWGYSYSYTGSSSPRCQAEGCSNNASSGETYCQICQPVQDLIRRVENKTSIRQVKDAEKFTTWWNNNLATVINGDSSFAIWLLVYDDKESRIRDFRTSSSHYGLSNAKNQASTLRINLNGDNPILYVHPKANTYASIWEILNSSYVEKIELPMETILMPTYYCRDLKNPDSHINPLDIIKIEKSAFFNRYQHVGIYLGNERICHIAGDKVGGEGIRICSWDEFMDAHGDWAGNMYRYRVLIPFKHYKLIASQIAYAESNQWREGDYCLANQNCEHAANMLIYGINFSEQAKEKPNLVSQFAKYEGVNNRKSSINLSNEISQTNNQLGKSNNWRAQQIEQNVQAIVPRNRSWL